MAGGLTKYRHLSRSSAHRQALLRNLVTALIDLERIQTTWPKAKETQRLAEKLITLAKRNNEETRRKAQAILYRSDDLMPKLFGKLRKRYLDRPGGYTRVLRTMPKEGHDGTPSYDQAPAAIIELVDGPKDMRLATTAAAVARDRHLGREHNPITLKNVAKVTRFRPDGDGIFEKVVRQFGPGWQFCNFESNGKEDKKGVNEDDEDGRWEDVEPPRHRDEKPKLNMIKLDKIEGWMTKNRRPAQRTTADELEAGREAGREAELEAAKANRIVLRMAENNNNEGVATEKQRGPKDVAAAPKKFKKKIMTQAAKETNREANAIVMRAFRLQKEAERAAAAN